MVLPGRKNYKHRKAFLWSQKMQPSKKEQLLMPNNLWSILRLGNTQRIGTWWTCQWLSHGGLTPITRITLTWIRRRGWKLRWWWRRGWITGKLVKKVKNERIDFDKWDWKAKDKNKEDGRGKIAWHLHFQKRSN
jgi:hypothetical protein